MPIITRVAAAASAVDRHGHRRAVSQCAGRARLLLGRERIAARSAACSRSRAEPRCSDAGRARRLRSGHGRTVPMPQPRLSIADSARAVLEPARLGCERLGVRRPQRQPRVRDLRDYATVPRSSRSRTLRIRARSSRFPANSSPWREVKVYQVRDTVAERWRAYTYVTTEAANSGLQTIDMSGFPLDGRAGSRTNMRHELATTLYVSNIDYATNAALPGATADTVRCRQQSGPGSWRAYSLANPAFPQLTQLGAVRRLHARLDEPRRHRRAGGAMRAGPQSMRGPRRFQRRSGAALGRDERAAARAARLGDEPEQPLHPFRVGRPRTART